MQSSYLGLQVIYIMSEFPCNLIVKQCVAPLTTSTGQHSRSFGTRLIPLMVVAFGAVTMSCVLRSTSQLHSDIRSALPLSK
jgi:hypothetical protein